MKPKDESLKAPFEKEEYSSKSELVNDLIRQGPKAAYSDWLRANWKNQKEVVLLPTPRMKF